VEICAADATPGYVDEYFAIFGFRLGNVFDSDVEFVVESGGFHCRVTKQ
jgi:hypothetical protein